MAQCRGQFLPARAVIVDRRLGQQQAGFEVGEPCRHDQIIGGDLETQAVLRGDEGEILVGQGQDRQLGEIDLLLARQGEQEVDRPLIAVEIEEERRLLARIRASRPGARTVRRAQPPCPVSFSTNWISASAGTPISHPSRLKWNPLRAPA